MRSRYVGVALGCLLGALLHPVVARSAEAGSKAVEVQVVDYRTLGDAILQARGKVCVIDFWADY